MPYLSCPTRRQFLAKTGGASVLLAQPQTTRWALLADTHVAENPADEYRGLLPYNNLQKVAPQVVEAAPDGAIIDGDLARLEGLPGDYRNLKKLLVPVTAEMPVAMALGNHDHRQNFLTMFRDDPGERHHVKGKCILSVEAGPVRFLLLDSLIQANVTSGFLGKAQRTWLDVFLRAAPSKPTIVFVHHTLDDGDSSLRDVLWMFRILRPQRMVKAVIYGHSHSYKFGTEDGIHLINIPAVEYNFSDHAPVGWVEATLSADGGDFRLHAIGGQTSGDGKVQSIRWRD